MEYTYFNEFIFYCSCIMKQHKQKPLFNKMLSMKKLHKKMYKFGAFYAKNWKILILVKVVIIAGVLSTIFISSDHNGRVFQNIPSAFANVRPKPSCWDWICLWTDAYCGVSKSDCSAISTWKCATVTWCSLTTKDNYACWGTTFSCAGATALWKSSCTNLWCFWSWDTNTCSNTDNWKTINELCSSLASATSCSLWWWAIGTCIWKKSWTIDSCLWTISVPEDETNCIILNSIIKWFWPEFTASWYEAYIENSNSCPADCGEDLCGNAICDDIAWSCELVKTDCSGISDLNLCWDISWCSVAPMTVYSCSWTTFSCTALTKEDECSAAGCAWDKWSSSCSVVKDDKGNPKTDETCAALTNHVSCEYVASNGWADCSWAWTVVDACVWSINTGDLSQSNCLSLGNLDSKLVSLTSWYVEDIASCPIDCGAQVDNCIWIPVEDCATYATKWTMLDWKDCTDYYSTSEWTQCIKNGAVCGPASPVPTCLVPDSTCWDREITWSEECDDGNVNDNDACSSTCIAQDYIVPYTPHWNITGVQWEGVYYEASSYWFFVPKDVSIFIFTDGSTLIWFSSNRLFFLIPYTPVWNIDNISSEDISRASWYNFFVMNYSWSITPSISEFTFTDNSRIIIASYSWSSWSFAEDTTPTCGWAPVAGCASLLLSYLPNPSTQCKLYYSSKSLLQCTYDRKSWACTDWVACRIWAVCWNKSKESGEACDDGNVKDNDGCSSTCQIESNYCGNGIVDTKETCDNGVNNWKVGQCNSSCNGWMTYNKSCGDGMCSSYCTLSNSMTCNSFNASDDTKALCSSAWCFLQTTNNYDCAGTVSCEKITKASLYNDQYMVRKYCNLAGCNYDDKSWLCSTPVKAPSCDKLPAAEYCKMLSPMWCSLTVDGISSTCVGNTSIRADKLDSNQCTTLDGKWNIEDEMSCSADCKPTCNSTSAWSCDWLNQATCEVSYANGFNCVYSQSKAGWGCTQWTACSACGNKVCDKDETYKTCPNDCFKSSDWPSISYSPRKPKDWSLVSWPVTATLNYWDSCSIVNNWKSSNVFKYNGYYIFKVYCPALSDKVLEMWAKVSWINDGIKTATNLNDFSVATSWSTLYCENGKNIISDLDPNNATMIDLAKKAIYEQSLRATDGTLKAEVTDKIVLSWNLYFSSWANTLTKIELEKTLANGAKKASVMIPEGAKVVVQADDGKTTDFEWIFLAPTTAESKVKNKLEEQVKNIENKVVASVVKFGDEDNKKLTLVTSWDVAEEFIISMELVDAKEGDLVEIFSSQNGDSWTSYWSTTVGKDWTITFAVPHLTYYWVTVGGDSEGEDEDEDKDDAPTWGNGWGGGGSVLVRDICPEIRDCSSSYYDQLCGPCPTIGDVAVDTGETITITKVNEQMIAYQYAFLHGITSKVYEEARLEDGITRWEMAKMISQFAKNILGKTPANRVCAFEDNIYGSKEDKAYIIQACQLWLMWLEADGKTPMKKFNPSWTLTRAEFGTIFSRLLYGGLYNVEAGSSVAWYANHLSALKNNGVMTKIDTPFNAELRGFVMIMMLRADLKDDGQLTTIPKKANESIWEKISNFLEKLF